MWWITSSAERSIRSWTQASKITRFMIKPLDPEYYQECVKVFQNLPELARVSKDEEDFISLFAFGVDGYTQRHGDVKEHQWRTGWTFLHGGLSR